MFEGISDLVPRLLTEAVIVGASIMLLIGYHWRLSRRLKTEPLTTTMGRQRLARASWLKLAERGDRELLTVQTMRNVLMAASFLASTAVLLAAAFLGGALTSVRFSEFANSLNVLGVETQGFRMFKALLLMVIFLIAFFAFSLAMRSFAHMGMLVHLASEDSEEISSEVISEELSRGAFHYALGMRCYYLAIPLTLWLFGPMWMLLATSLLIVALNHVD
jgi:uncharacterized membrane protein